MGTTVVETKYDDINSNTPADETVSFGLDGVSYSIDLSATNADKLRKQFSHWIDHGRPDKVRGHRRGRKPGRKPGRPRRTTSAAARKEFNSKVREWAADNGIELGARGRIPDSVVEQYNNA